MFLNRVKWERYTSNLLNIKPYSILMMLFSLVAVVYAQVSVEPATLITIELAVFFTTNWLENNVPQARKCFSTVMQKLGLAVATLIMAFSLAGSKCFVFPLNKPFTPHDFLAYFAVAVSMFPIATWALFHLVQLRPNSGCRQKTPRWLLVTCAAIFAASALIYLVAFNPCISSPDTLYCMNTALGSVFGLSNWHPAFYIIWLKLILTVWRSPYAVVGVQLLLFAIVLLRTISLAYKKGVREGWIICFTVLLGLNCSTMVHLIAIWKDIPYTICLLWTTVLIMTLLLDEGARKSIGVCVELVIALVGVCFFRHNGIVTYILVSVVLVMLFFRNKRVLLAVAAALGAVLFIRFPLYTALDTYTYTGGGKYVGLGQDILGVYYSGGDVSEEATDMIVTLTGGDLENFDYSPYYAKSEYNLEVEIPQFVRVYMDTFLNNPVLMSRSILCRQDCLWNIFRGEEGILGGVNFIWTVDNDSNWTENWPQREENTLTDLMSNYTSWTASEQLTGALIWRAGIWLIVEILALIALAMKSKDKRLLCVAVPCAGHILSLLLSTGWADFRYYWPVQLMSMLSVITALVCTSKDACCEEKAE